MEAHALERKWTHLIDSAGDEGIGSVLVRLARQAADAHMAELTAALSRLDADRSERSAASSHAAEEVSR